MTLKWNFPRDGGVQEKKNLPWEGYGHLLEQHMINLCTSQIKASTSSPHQAGQPSVHMNFWKIIVQIPPSAGRKAVQMPPPSCAFGVGARAYFPNSGWWSSLKNYCLYCKDSFNIYILTGNRFQTPSNTEQSLCRPLVFNQSATNIHFFLLNSSKLVSAVIYKLTWNQRNL